MKSYLKIFLAILVVLLVSSGLVAFSPAFSGIRAKLQCFTESGNCVEGWNGTDLALYSDTGSTNTFNVEGAAGAVRIAVPTTAGTATPGLVIQQGANGNALEVRNSGGTPVASISGGGALSGFGSSGLVVAPNIVVNGGTAIATQTPAAIVDSLAAGSNLFEVRDAATPVAVIPNGGGLTISAGTVSLPTGEIGAGEIADVTRRVNIPLNAFIECQTDAGALLGFDTTADALPDFVNSATDGTGFVIRFDDTGSSEDQGTEICSQLSVPADYASGGVFIIRALKDAHTAATEVLNCAVSVNGGALETAGTTTTTASATTSYTCTPTIAALASNDSLSFYLSITSDSTMNDLVDIASVAFSYTATQ